MSKISNLKIYKRMLSGLTALVLLFSSAAALGEEKTNEKTNEVKQEEMKNNKDFDQEAKQMTYDEFKEITEREYEEYSFYYIDHPIELIDYQLGYFMENIDSCQNIFQDLYNDGIIEYTDYKMFETNLTLGRQIVDIISAPRFPGWKGNYDFLHYEKKDKEFYRELFELASKLYVNALSKNKVDIEDLRRFIQLGVREDLTLEEKINVYYAFASVDVIETALRTQKNGRKEMDKFFTRYEYYVFKPGITLDPNSDDVYELFVLYLKFRFDLFKEMSKTYDYIFLDRLVIDDQNIK